MTGAIVSPAGLPAGAEPAGSCRWAAVVEPDALVPAAAALVSGGMRLALVSGHDDPVGPRVTYLFTSGPPDHRVELHVPLEPGHPCVPTLAGLSFQGSRFEREMADLFGFEPLDHPQKRRLVLHQHWPDGWYPMRRDAGPMPALVADAGQYPFVPVEGTGVYEIPVGPVHAGLIEPGHFRFWVVGETILRMKARLWFVHKGIEKLFEHREPADGLGLAEKISGDSAVGHGLAYCQAVEDASGIEVPADAQVLRAALLELERLYNHVADVGALCNDVGFGLANAWALSLRELLLRLNADVTGHRLLRGGVVLGGAAVHRLPTAAELTEVSERFEEIAELARTSAFVMERFTGTATLSEANAADLGVVGPAGRASGLAFDARVSHPHWDSLPTFEPARHTGGDVLARYLVRTDEIRSSLGLLAGLAGLGPSVCPAAGAGAGGAASRSGVGIVEGWRGAIVHRIELDSAGQLGRVKVVDPSFLNWPAVPVSLANTIVPDFPLANKSFNLSYAGNDL
jgi:Ni,Fe-hydrogenase III large subunit/Ni,Fe-hydrogenase III component G